ncbi:MAG TPA: hypothetical protein VES39_01910 [Rhodospirillales bacterium]|nr:hypothetical protein [Rhodospirillales bacterium]
MYYPLDAGIVWQYRVSLIEGGAVVAGNANVLNLEPATIFDHTAVPQRSDLFGQTVVRYLAQTEGGIVQIAQQSGTAPPVANNPPDYVLRLPLNSGTSWSSTWNSARERGRVSFPTVKTITGNRDTVMVPAGTFTDCLHVRIAGRSEVALLAGPATVAVTGEEWYAPDVGFIKGAFRETVNQGEAAIELAINLESFGRAR